MEAMSSVRASKAPPVRQQTTLPLVVEKDEDGFYVIECPVLRGCYSQGRTRDEALKNVQEVISLLSKDEEQKIL